MNGKVQCVVTGRLLFYLAIRGQDASYFLGFREKERLVEGSIEYRIAKEASPISHVTPDDAPILLVHGDADETVLFSQSERMFAKLQKAGVPSKLVGIEGGGHGFNFSGAANLPDLPKIYIQWMDKHLRHLAIRPQAWNEGLPAKVRTFLEPLPKPHTNLAGRVLLEALEASRMRSILLVPR